MLKLIKGISKVLAALSERQRAEARLADARAGRETMSGVSDMVGSISTVFETLSDRERSDRYESRNAARETKLDKMIGRGLDVLLPLLPSLLLGRDMPPDPSVAPGLGNAATLDDVIASGMSRRGEPLEVLAVKLPDAPAVVAFIAGHQDSHKIGAGRVPVVPEPFASIPTLRAAYCMGYDLANMEIDGAACSPCARAASPAPGQG